MKEPPIITLIGGSGFVGRHTVKKFAQAGWQVRVLCRDITAAAFFKREPYADHVMFDHADITRPDTLAGKLDGSTAAVNLVSILYESASQKFNTINIAGAQAIAEEAARAQVKRLIHISALGIKNASAQYAATKRGGEEVVKAAFPTATILRPSLIIGKGDGFFGRFARMSTIAPALPLVAGGRTRFQPVMVSDVAQAIFNTVMHDDTAGKTYTIAGPHVYDFKQLLQMMLTTIRRSRVLLPLPSVVANVMGFCCEQLPFPPMITRDQVRMLKVDSVMQEGELGLGALRIVPQSISDALPELLAHYIKN